MLLVGQNFDAHRKFVSLSLGQMTSSQLETILERSQLYTFKILRLLLEVYEPTLEPHEITLQVLFLNTFRV